MMKFPFNKVPFSRVSMLILGEPFGLVKAEAPNAAQFAPLSFNGPLDAKWEQKKASSEQWWKHGEQHKVGPYQS